MPIALGILGANGDLGDAQHLTDILAVGELSLDGRVRAVRGALPIALRARQSQTKHLLLPDENAKEAAVVAEVNVYGVTDLRNAVELIAAIRSANPPEPIRVDPAEILIHDERYAVDFREVRGQQVAQRALEVATPLSPKATAAGEGPNAKLTCATPRSFLPSLTVSISIRDTQLRTTSRIASSDRLETRSASKFSIDSTESSLNSASSDDSTAAKANFPLDSENFPQVYESYARRVEQQNRLTSRLLDQAIEKGKKKAECEAGLLDAKNKLEGFPTAEFYFQQLSKGISKP